MKEAELTILGSERDVDVPAMKTATDEQRTKYIEYVQSGIVVFETKIKVMKLCKNLLQYYNII